jgi:hypothetical protein
MTTQEYEEKLLILKKDHDAKILDLAREFAMSNNPVKLQDIVTDHIGSVKVDKIGLSIHNQKPSCFYSGMVLKKDLTPTKKFERRNVYQINLQNHIKNDR